MNTGYMNTGDRNTGDWNTGYRNMGDRNTGYRNMGDGNTGYMNTGDRNTGDWNTGDWNTGCFNVDEPPVRIFGKETSVKREDIIWPDCFFFETIIWVPSDTMTDAEKKNNPSHETTGGYLKEVDYKEAWANALKDLSDENRLKILALPNYDPDIFEEITGVRVEEKPEC